MYSVLGMLVANLLSPFSIFSYGFVFGIFAFFEGFRLLQRKRLIENTPTSKIRSIAMGFAEVRGKISVCTDAAVEKSGFLKSPISGAKCVYYDAKVEEIGLGGIWETTYHRTDIVHFNVSDKTGTVLVDPKGATLDIIRKDFYYETDRTDSISGRKMPKNCSDFCARNRIHCGPFSAYPKYFTERYLAPGDSLYILGTAMKNPYIHSSKVKSDAVMMAKGIRGEKTFYISESGEKNILSKLHHSALIWVFGGAALSVACLFLLVCIGFYI